MKHLVPLFAVGLTLTACSAACVAQTSAQQQTIVAELTIIANTATRDLNTAIAVALVAKPPDIAGAACAWATLQVAGDIQKVMAATPAGTVVGAFTVAEIGSFYAPGLPLFNAAVTTIETGCTAKVHAVIQDNQATAGLPAAIVAALGVTALSAGL